MDVGHLLERVPRSIHSLKHIDMSYTLDHATRALVPPVFTIAELNLTYKLSAAPAARTKIHCSEDFIAFIRPYYGDQIETRELFFAVFMNQANHVVGVYALSTGGLTGTVADIRLILATALLSMTNQIIVTHNHPSGNLEPSGADRALTEKLKHAGATHDIRLIDHIIMTEHGHYSFGDNGIMPS